MADLTLERIAELRANHKPITAERGIDAAMKVIEVLPALLDAAERGLTNDRKASALDALDAMLASGRVILKRPIYNRDLRIVDYAGSRILVFHVDQLVDGIEQVDHMLKEPTDAQ